MQKDDDPKDKRAFIREKVRALCRFEIDGQVQSGFLLNLSPRGFFLQTRLRLPAGTELEMNIPDLGPEPIEIVARVIHTTSAHRATSPVETGGIGFEIVSAPEVLYTVLYQLGSV